MLMEIKIRRRRRPSSSRAPRRWFGDGMAGMGAVAERVAALEKYFTAVRAQHQKNRLRALDLFGRSITFAQYAAEMKTQAGVAASLRLLAERHATLLPSQKAELAGVTTEITELWKVATQQAAKTPNNRITPQTARVRVDRLYGWLDRVSGQVQAEMKRPKAIETAADAAKDLPGNLLAWLVDQLKKPLGAMGIPPWVLPVAGIALALGLAAPIVGPAVAGLGSIARQAGSKGRR